MIQVHTRASIVTSLCSNLNHLANLSSPRLPQSFGIRLWRSITKLVGRLFESWKQTNQDWIHGRRLKTSAIGYPKRLVLSDQTEMNIFANLIRMQCLCWKRCKKSQVKMEWKESKQQRFSGFLPLEIIDTKFPYKLEKMRMRRCQSRWFVLAQNAADCRKLYSFNIFHNSLLFLLKFWVIIIFFSFLWLYWIS